MEEVLKVVVMGRAARNTANIKNRQPIGQYVREGTETALPEFYQEIIQDELNVKNVEFTDDVRAFTSYSFKPQLQYRWTASMASMLNEIKEILAESGRKCRRWMTLNETGRS